MRHVRRKEALTVKEPSKVAAATLILLFYFYLFAAVLIGALRVKIYGTLYAFLHFNKWRQFLRLLFASMDDAVGSESTLNPTVPRTAKTLRSFGLSECSRVNGGKQKEQILDFKSSSKLRREVKIKKTGDRVTVPESVFIHL